MTHAGDSSTGNRIRSVVAGMAVLLGTALAGGCSSNPSPAFQRMPPGPCDTNVERLPNDSEWLERMSVELPQDEPPFSISLVPTVPVPIRLDTSLGFASRRARPATEAST